MPTQSQTIEHVRGDTLSFLVSLTLDGQPFPWADWSTLAQLRQSENSGTVLDEFVISSTDPDLAPGQARFKLVNPTRSGVWDVQFTNEDGNEVVTWPGKTEPRHTLVLTPDVSRPEPEVVP